MLQLLPSVVAYFEDGLGVGNTSLRVRGTDATRINVTLNGMPLNNPESQEVYWVNIPDLNSHLQSMQLQRGVGTSTNGAAAFGASLSLKTLDTRRQAYAEAATTWGSYNTLMQSVAVGSGALPYGLHFDARYSHVGSDGYIRNGKVNHQSFQAALSHVDKKQWAKLVYLRGEQHTGITWEGISPEDMETYGRRYNIAGEYTDDAGNVHYYDNETDNYYSDIVQLLYSRKLTDHLALNANLSYNHGFGYYENYKTGEKYKSKFGLTNQTVNDSVYTKSDIIRRKNMDNGFYAAQLLLNYKHRKLDASAGAMYSRYAGDHYGNLLWVKYNENIPDNYEWYRNDALKEDVTLFVKGEYQLLQPLTAYADVQARFVRHNFDGIDDDLTDIADKNTFNFINPKAGLFARLNRHHTLYGSWAMAHREPLRADLKEAIKGGGAKNIVPELMHDAELGYQYRHAAFAASANFYYMYYIDQMVQTGKLNDVGYKLMENVPKSYRAGIELQAAWTPSEHWKIEGNATLSRNKILNYTAYYDLYDASYEFVKQTTVFYKSTDISFSPDVVAAGIVTFVPVKNWNIAAIGKYVGKQYYDNTSNDINSLPAYYVCNLSTHYNWTLKSGGSIRLYILVNNVFNRLYCANAWVSTDRFTDGSEAVYKGLFPQAGANFMAKLEFGF
jgi:iron complex outermembrane receptor protein